MQKEETVLNIQFVLLDCSQLKFSLVQHCNEWQNKFTTLLKEMAARRLLELHAYLQENSEKYDAARGPVGHSAQAQAGEGRPGLPAPSPPAPRSLHSPAGSAALPRRWRNWGSVCNSWIPCSMTCPTWRPRSLPSTSSSPSSRSTRCRFRTA